MDGIQSRRRARLAAALLAALLPACSPRVAVEDLPEPRETLAEAGRRLSASRSAEELTTIARRGDRVLALLSRGERDAVARGHLRFRLDRPAILDVAAPERSAPFWLADLGFARTPEVLRPPGGGRWRVDRKTVGAGWVGLGVNGLDLGPEDHYVVFVRPIDGGRPPRVEGLDPSRWRVVAAADGVSAARDASRPLGPLPAGLRGAALLQPSQDLRHSTRLASGRVWKTHVVSGPAPDQVAIAFGDDAARSLTWTWRTAPDAARGAVRFARADARGRGPAEGAEVRVVAAESTLVETPSVLNDPAIRRHRARAMGLEPATLYAYALGDGTPSGWSPWATVTTAPAGPADATLLYIGDPQTGLEAWGRLLRDARARHPEAGVLLIAGDLVDRGNERTNWDHFFLRARGVFDGLPVMPCVGNHEYLDRGPRLYRAFFEPPRNGPAGVDPGLVYAFEYGGAFIGVLDSTLGLYEPDLARRQAEWLDERLARTRAPWKLVMFHHPVYASHPTRENPALGKAWGPVFDRHRVDLVLQGHDHAYLRTHPMRAGRRVSTPAEGTTYVVSVSGDKFYGQNPRDYTARGLTRCSTYQTIELRQASGRLVYRAWDAEGREVDRLEIVKEGAAGERPTLATNGGRSSGRASE